MPLLKRMKYSTAYKYCLVLAGHMKEGASKFRNRISCVFLIAAFHYKKYCVHKITTDRSHPVISL